MEPPLLADAGFRRLHFWASEKRTADEGEHSTVVERPTREFHWFIDETKKEEPILSVVFDWPGEPRRKLEFWSSSVAGHSVADCFLEIPGKNVSADERRIQRRQTSSSVEEEKEWFYKKSDSNLCWCGIGPQSGGQSMHNEIPTSLIYILYIYIFKYIKCVIHFVTSRCFPAWQVQQFFYWFLQFGDNKTTPKIDNQMHEPDECCNGKKRVFAVV